MATKSSLQQYEPRIKIRHTKKFSPKFTPSLPKLEDSQTTTSATCYVLIFAEIHGLNAQA